MTTVFWAHMDQESKTINVNPFVWDHVINNFYTMWEEYVFDSKDERLLAPSRQHPRGGIWQGLTPSRQADAGARSLAYVLRTYAKTSDGTSIHPTRSTLAHQLGYAEGNLNAVDRNLHRLQSYGFIQSTGEQVTRNGKVPIYRTTIPALLPVELKELWDAQATGPSKNAISAVNDALTDAEIRALRNKDLKLAYSAAQAL